MVSPTDPSTQPTIQPADRAGVTNAGQPRGIDLPVILAVWGSLLLYSAVATPVPAVNEPHYLCKARHFWQPDWCAGDFFLQSANAHTVFFATVGSLTQWFTLDQTAWIGRAVALLVLGAGWSLLLRNRSPDRWSALHAAWLFLALQACGNFSGEWLVGGVEGKVFSYGLLFGALGFFEQGRLILAGAGVGLAVAFHPVIGLWGLLAFAAARLTEGLLDRSRSSPGVPEFQENSFRPGRACWLPAVAILVVCALPGLIPVYWLLAEPVPAPTKAAANYIQVYYRLAHHLDPMTFLPRAYAGYGALLTVWLFLIWRARRTACSDNSYARVHRRFDRITAFAVVFALAGLVIGWGPRPAQEMVWYSQRAQLLKFYPFRLADILVPLAVSIGLVNWLASLRRRRAVVIVSAAWFTIMVVTWGRAIQASGDWRHGVKLTLSMICLWALGTGAISWVEFTARRGRSLVSYGILFAVALVLARGNVEVNRYSGELRQDWIAACRWIDQNLPGDALIHTPHNGWAFKWFAHRAEYVAFKDCPQDAAGIVEWNRRLNFLKKWFESNYADKLYSADELRDLRARTQITHILTDRLGPMELAPIFRNETFQVYDLTSLDES